MKLNLPKELVLNGTDNDGARHRYSFDKNPEIKGGLKKLLVGLEFEEKKVGELIEGIFIKRNEDENYQETITILQSKEINDKIYYLKNKKYEIDLFFGKNKVILLIRTKKEREKLVSEIENRTSWISGNEKKRRLEQKNPKGIIKKISKPKNKK